MLSRSTDIALLRQIQALGTWVSPSAMCIWRVARFLRIPKTSMANTSKTVHIPLSPAEAIRLIGKVKPTSDMPRQGAHPTTAKKKARKKRAS